MKVFINILILLIVLAAVAGAWFYAFRDGREPPQDESRSEQDVSSVSQPEAEPDVQEPPPSHEDPDNGSQSGADADLESSSRAQSAPLTERLTIPEGYTLARVGMTLEEKGICTAEEFIAAAQEGDFSEFPLIAAQKQNPNRCFKLEGYLFPDTYEIYTKDSPDAIIRRMLTNTEKKIDAGIRERIAQSGYTVDEIITLASIIEKEAFGPEPMPDLSSALHNRLNIGMKLQCDVTIIYVEGAIKPFITGDKNRYNSYYNTYKCQALPAGAICNPSLSAIKAALSPSDTDYLFFVTDADKNYYFSADWEDHKAKTNELGIS